MLWIRVVFDDTLTMLEDRKGEEERERRIREVSRVMRCISSSDDVDGT